MGALRRRGKVWWIRYCRNGRRYEESSKSTKRGVALTLLQLREGAGAQGIPVTPAMGRLTFDDAATAVVTDYVVNQKKSVGVLRRRIAKHLTPFFGGRRMASITTTDVLAYVRLRQQPTELPDGTARPGASNAEINRELTALKRAFSLAVKSNQLLFKPHIPLLAENNTRTGFLEPDQLASVLRHLPAAVRPLIEFAAITGWRVPSEVLPLTWSRVDLRAGIVRLDIGTTKSGEGRVFPMTKALRSLLELQRAEADRAQRETDTIIPWVFFRLVAKGREGPKVPKPIKSITKAWRTACRNAGCPGRIPHDLRRTAVRSLVRAGISEKVAMTMTGHKTRSVFERYNIVSEGDLFAAAAKLDAVASPSGTNMGQSAQPGSGGVPVSA